MGEDSLRALIRDLIAMRVGMEVKAGQPTLAVPPTAEAMVRNNLDAIRANRDEITRLWAELAAESSLLVLTCKECKALVLDPSEGAVSRWAFCESTYCPYRLDDTARRAQQRWLKPAEQTWRERLEQQRRTRAIALGEDEPEPIPE